MKEPKKIKYRKMHQGRKDNGEILQEYVKYGDVGIRIDETGFISQKETESIKKEIIRETKKKKILIRIIWTKSINYGRTKKLSEVRMGRGVGKISEWFTRIQSGEIIMEIKIINRNSLSILMVNDHSTISSYPMANSVSLSIDIKKLLIITDKVRNKLSKLSTIVLKT